MARLQVLPLPTPDGEAPRFVLVADEVEREAVELATYGDQVARVVPSDGAVDFEARLSMLGTVVGAAAVVSFAERVDVVPPAGA
jgi:hypothetical protein